MAFLHLSYSYSLPLGILSYIIFLVILSYSQLFHDFHGSSDLKWISRTST